MKGRLKRKAAKFLKEYKRYALAGLVCLLGFNVCSCGRKTDSISNLSVNLMETVLANEVNVETDIEEIKEPFSEFSAELFKQSIIKGEEGLISPISVMLALAMAANGADNNTLSQIEETIGIDIEKLNDYMYLYLNSIKSQQTCKVNIADSIWFRDIGYFEVNKNFLQKNADYYKAEIFKAPFDNTTKNDINKWVNDNTDNMISNILDNIPKEALMYIINAVAFDGEWTEKYKDSSIIKENFTTYSGEVKETDLMHSKESFYMEDENACGFMKFYKGGRYAFAAVLPNEGIDVYDYINSLNGQKLMNILKYTNKYSVYAAIPEFSGEFSYDMENILKNMGIVDAFDEESADFSLMGDVKEGNIYINRVIHKTFIEVDKDGTKAAASTLIEMANNSAMPMEEVKEVILNRPFIYMIVDCETNIPLFMGVKCK